MGGKKNKKNKNEKSGASNSTPNPTPREQNQPRAQSITHQFEQISVSSGAMQQGQDQQQGLGNQQSPQPVLQQSNQSANQQSNQLATQKSNPPKKQQSNQEPKQQSNQAAKQQCNPPAKQQTNPTEKQQSNQPEKQKSNQPAKQQSNQPAKQQSNQPAKQQSHQEANQQLNQAAKQQSNPPPKHQSNQPAKQQSHQEANRQLNQESSQQWNQAAKQQSNKPAKQQWNPETKQQWNQAAKQQSNPPAKQQWNQETNQQWNQAAKQQSNPPAKQQWNQETNQLWNQAAKQQSNPSAKQQWNQETNQQWNQAAKQQSNPPPRHQSNQPAKQQSNPPAKQQWNQETNQQWNQAAKQQSNPPAKQQSNPPARQQSNPPTEQQSNPPTEQQSNPPAKQQSNQPPKEVKTNMPHLLCPYKGHGTKGSILQPIETNYLKIIINKIKENAYHYDIQIEPDKPKKHLTKVFQLFCKANFPNTGIAFDGMRSAYAAKRLSLDHIVREVEFVHPDTHGIRKYIVAIKETEDMIISLKSLQTYNQTRQYDMPRKALQCLEIILKGAFQQPHLDSGVYGGKSYFLPPHQREYLGDFFELWLGLFQSTVLGASPYLNVDVAHKAFPRRYDSLIQLLEDVKREHDRSRDFFDDLNKHLSGMDIIYRNPGNGQKRIYKYLKLANVPKNESFKDQDNRTLTVEQYFREKNYRISRPELPCIKLGNSIKYITVPMEYCSLPDRQAVNKKCTEQQTRNIIRFAATSTDERKRKILELLNHIKHNNSPIIQDFNVQLDMNFAKVPARKLNPPEIQYKNTTVMVQNGVWRGEKVQYLIPESANKWAILNFNQRTRREELNDLEFMLYNTSKSSLLNLSQRAEYKNDPMPQNMCRELEDAKKKGIRILFCVIPDSGPTYAKVKKTAELQVGVLTQCIKGGTVFRKRNDSSTISNILLKVNAKLNGTNHCLADAKIISEKCMFVGADVTHPSPDQRDIPSVVGVAASHDRHSFCYNVCWRLQGPRVEIIQDFQAIVLEHLRFYKQKNGHLPDKIFYYRDGVSEGQFQQVMASEKIAMHSACRQMEQGYEKKVKLTIIVVQKRHHTRFFPGKTGIGDRKNNNVPAGTIVDTEIVHPQENHFYLVSHQSIQGVAKPTKYCILYDDGNHSIDSLQELTYHLCHLFSRCNRSVSYPAPTYYAHLAAYRGRVYIENERLNLSQLDKEWRNRGIKDDIAKGHPMFFV